MRDFQSGCSRGEKHIPEHQSHICRAVWISTIIQTLIDAASNNKEPCYRKIRKEAREWLSQPCEDSDFATTCDLAGIEPLAVKRLHRAMRDQRVTTVNFRWLRREPDSGTRDKLLNPKRRITCQNRTNQ